MRGFSYFFLFLLSLVKSLKSGNEKEIINFSIYRERGKKKVSLIMVIKESMVVDPAIEIKYVNPTTQIEARI